MQTLIIDESWANVRLDSFVRKRYAKHNPSMPLSHIFQALRKGTIKVNNKKHAQNYRLLQGDHVSLPIWFEKNIVPKKTYKYTTDSDDLDPSQFLLFHDTNRCIWNKPAWISMFSSPGQSTCMYEILRQRAQTQPSKDNLSQPAFCHRLDRDTSWVCIAWMQRVSCDHFATQLHTHSVKKIYLTIVGWKLWNQGKRRTIKAPLTKIFDTKFQRWKISIDKSWKMSITHIRNICEWTLPSWVDRSLACVRLETGRMHQIRAHCAYIGYPLLGDVVYGIPSANRKFFRDTWMKHHLLHCWDYEFRDCDGSLIQCTAPLPPYWDKMKFSSQVKEKLSIGPSWLDIWN